MDAGYAAYLVLVATWWAICPPGSFFYAFASFIADHILSLANNGSELLGTYANAEGYWGVVANSGFIAALSSSDDSKDGRQDMYGNLHIPMLEAQSDGDEVEWHDTSSRSTSTNAALLGVPIIGIPENANSSFSMQVSYFYLDCNISSSTYTTRNETMAYAAYDIPGSQLNASAKVYNFTAATGSFARNIQGRGGLLRDLTANHRWNDSIPWLIGFQSRTWIDGRTRSEAWCNMTTTYVDARAACYGGARNCSIQAIRRSPDPPCLLTATGLDGVGQNYTCDNVVSTYVAESFFPQFMNAVIPGDNDRYTALEQYFLTPNTPFMYGDPSIPIAEIGPQLFS